MKNILVIGSGRSAVTLIKYLLYNTEVNNWFVRVADFSLELAEFENKENKELRYILNMEGAIKTTLKGLLDKQCISKDEYERLLPIGSQPGILYGCAKIHK